MVPHLAGHNRDPKVVFCEEWGAYAMVLYLENETYGLLRSNDLLHWELVQRLETPGDNECPDLFPLTADNGQRKWVFIGAHDRYWVGDIKQDGFCSVQELQSLHYGKSAYAGQTISGLPNGRIVRIDWDRWGLPTPNFSGQMSFPTEFSLKEINGIYYLCALPIREIEGLSKGYTQVAGRTLCAGRPERILLEQAPYWIKMQLAPSPSAKLTVKVFGIELELDRQENSIRLGDKTAPITLTGTEWVWFCWWIGAV